MSYSATAGLGAEQSDDRRARARQAYAEGERLYQAGDYSGAAKLFHRAYETYPLPTVLVAIAMSYRDMNEMERAKQWAQRYLYADPSGPQAEQASTIKADAERALQAQATATPEVPRDVVRAPAQPLPATEDAYPERASKAIWVISGVGLVGLVGLGWYLTRSPKPVRANRRRRRTSRRR